MRVLHITGWYPNERIPHESPFIERHVKALAPHCENVVWHIDVRTAPSWSWLGRGTAAHRTFVLFAAWHRWLALEWMATALILWAWITRNRSAPIDLVNFHIAYPNCSRVRFLRQFIRRPMVITEHFSAYRIGFNSASKGVDRIRRIFHAGIPLIVVSNALKGDIVRFAGPPEPSVHIVDNAVDQAIFHPDPADGPEKGRFFAIAGWRSPKRPDLLLDALAILREEGYPIRLRLAGIGPGSEGISKRIAELGLTDAVDVLGQQDERAVASEMRKAHALVHASDYETYSAVCAEALCCGTPVIASNVGGIPEFMTTELGALVPANSAEEWARVWRENWDHTWNLDRDRVARTMQDRAGFDVVGARYYAVLRSALEQHA